ncbi:MetQ/NlpA family ABC transporter substrate-binding protein [Pseudonocardia halophobica]|uniref:Lipoprotein n=1 Tax=Pseudonocardia halophobica TaxID=29401 RepID=A0A9W6L1N0_9PSEU|nr:MetQ/NlpA family ABC transporter substrate-binding protein [Pseudonocardia halophobica]GLL10550.1 lipoprotein [Pseudonocardia halophobica]
MTSLTPGRRALALLAALGALMLAGCGSADPASTTGPADHGAPLRLSVLISGDGGASSKLARYLAAEVAPDYDAELTFETITSAEQLSQTVADGEIDANFISTGYWVAQQVADGGYKVRPVLATHFNRFSIVSTKYPSLREVPDGASVVLPNDPSNLAQGLLLLAQEGLIQLEPSDRPELYTQRQITANPKNLRIEEAGLAQIPRSLPDVDLGVTYDSVFLDGGVAPEDFLATFRAPSTNWAIHLVVGENIAPERLATLEQIFEDPRATRFVSDQLKDVALPLTAGVGS